MSGYNDTGVTTDFSSLTLPGFGDIQKGSSISNCYQWSAKQLSTLRHYAPIYAAPPKSSYGKLYDGDGFLADRSCEIQSIPLSSMRNKDEGLSLWLAYGRKLSFVNSGTYVYFVD